MEMKIYIYDIKLLPRLLSCQKLKLLLTLCLKFKLHKFLTYKWILFDFTSISYNLEPVIRPSLNVLKFQRFFAWGKEESIKP